MLKYPAFLLFLSCVIGACTTTPKKPPDHGFVRISYDLDPYGSPHNIKITESSDPVFEEPAINQIKKWHPPASDQNSRTEVKGKVVMVEFHVTDQE